MANPISRLLSKIIGWFKSLDDEAKMRVIDYIVEGFKGFIRAYYRMKTAGNGRSGPQGNDNGGAA